MNARPGDSGGSEARAEVPSWARACCHSGLKNRKAIEVECREYREVIFLNMDCLMGRQRPDLP